MLQPKLTPARFWTLSAAGALAFLTLWVVAAQSGLVPRMFLPGPL